MRRKITDSRWLYAVLAILMSVLLWGFVRSTLNPDQPKAIYDIPVTFAGVDVLETRHLIISGGSDQTMNLWVRAKLDVLPRLSRDSITIRADVSKITGPGVQRLPIQIIYPLTVQTGSVTIDSDRMDLSDLYIRVTIAKSEAKEVPVKAEFAGSVAEGYQLGDIAVTPSVISISGQQELVDKVAYVKVILTQNELNATYTGDLPFTYIGTDGEVLSGLDITAGSDTIHVTYPVVKVVNVPLAVGVNFGGGITEGNLEDYVDIDIQPKSISVSGEEDNLANLKQLYVGQIDLSKIVTSEKFTFTLDVGHELTNESGFTEVKVQVTVKGLTTREFSVDDIQLINIPAGYAAEAVTQTRTVMVRGPKDAVEAVFKSQLGIVVDVAAGIPAAAVGRFDIPAKVHLNGSSAVGVVGTYNISVSLSR